MYRIAILEANVYNRNWIKHEFTHLAFQMNMEFSVESFAKPDELYHSLLNHKEDYDLILCDIDIPLNQMWNLARYYKKMQFHIRNPIIFMSQQKKVSIGTIRFQAHGLLFKPVMYQNLLKTVIDYIVLYPNKDEVFWIYNKKKKIRISCNKVKYIVSDLRKIFFYTIDGKYYTYGKLSQFIREQKRTGFIRIHNSFIVNTEYIKEVCKNIMILTDGTELRISNRYLKNTQLILNS